MPIREPRPSRINPFIALDSQGKIATRLPCHGCHYLLVGQIPHADCPECGQPITQSLRHGLPRFAPSFRLESVSQASLALLLGWALLLVLGLGTVVTVPASLYFLSSLRKMKIISRGFDVLLILIFTIMLGAAGAAVFYYLEWRSSYSFWFGYSNIDDGFYFALAVLWLTAVIGSAAINGAAIRFAQACQWPSVARTAWITLPITLLFGLVPAAGPLLEVTTHGGVFKLWWVAWDDTLGSPVWPALAVVAIAQATCWFRLRRALGQLTKERYKQVAPRGQRV